MTDSYQTARKFAERLKRGFGEALGRNPSAFRRKGVSALSGSLSARPGRHKEPNVILAAKLLEPGKSWQEVYSPWIKDYATRTVEIIEHEILVTCTQRYVRLLTTPDSGLIVSLRYFKDAIKEAASPKVSNYYWWCLRHSIDGLEDVKWMPTARATRLKMSGTSQ